MHDNFFLKFRHICIMSVHPWIFNKPYAINTLNCKPAIVQVINSSVNDFGKVELTFRGQLNRVDNLWFL